LRDLVIREVLGGGDLDAFIEAARRAESSNPRWIEPLRIELKKVLDPVKSPVIRENKVRAFVAFSSGKPVGRIATIVNRAYLQKYRDGCGHFGLIEALDDADIFKALLEKAKEVLRDESLVRMQGPSAYR